MFLKDDLDYPSSPIFLLFFPQQKMEGHHQDTRAKTAKYQKGEGRSEKRQKRLETPKSVPLRAKQQRPAALRSACTC